MTRHDPLALLRVWLQEAEAGESINPSAAALATATPDGRPSVRMVLIRGIDARGVVFYTNLGSRKGRELAANPRAAICIYWKALDRQVRIEGDVEPVSAAQADEYFASRPRQARIGAWASRQSAPLESRFALEKEVARYAAKFGVGAVPRPPFWSGFRLAAQSLEFWQQGAFRLHERSLYTLDGDAWTVQQLYP